MRRSWAIGLSVLAVPAVLAAACGGLIAINAVRHPPISDENAHSIREGMTRAEVEVILGEPHQRYSAVGADDESWIYYKDILGGRYLGIRFGPDGRVVGIWV